MHFDTQHERLAADGDARAASAVAYDDPSLAPDNREPEPPDLQMIVLDGERHRRGNRDNQSAETELHAKAIKALKRAQNQCGRGASHPTIRAFVEHGRHHYGEFLMGDPCNHHAWFECLDDELGPRSSST